MNQGLFNVLSVLTGIPIQWNDDVLLPSIDEALVNPDIVCVQV
jgi:hypothetical protein